jgi:3-dehydroquinate synthase
VELKLRIVRRDERDAGRRAVLNFGHTVGHAIESATGFRQRHGPAVAAGMTVEARLASRATGFPEADAARLEALLRAFGLPTSLPHGLSPEEVDEAAHRDAKARKGRPRYALPVRIGRMLPGDAVTVELDEALVCAGIATCSPSAAEGHG